MMNTSLVMALTAKTIEWSPTIGLIMSLSCLFAVAIGRTAIQQRGVGPALPLSVPALFKGFGVAELLATMSFGHLLGAGMVLGLSNAGVL